MKKVLLCEPNHFRVEYKINPWMKIGSVKQSLALKQWNKLVEEYKRIGLDIKIIKQDARFPDMVFATDQGIVFNERNVLLSRFRHIERRGESELYKKWYEDHGYRIINLPENLFFEGGGELQHWRDKVIIGTGFRTDDISANAVGKILDKEVIKIKLIDKNFYHLDTCLMVLNDDVIFYYPKALSKDSIALLKSMVPKLIEIDEVEAYHFAANSVVIGSTVLIQQGNPNMAKQISDYGFKVISIDLSEFMKAGGGAHCLTGNLG